MDELRKVAFFTVAKGSAYGLLAIGCMMIGFSYAPRFALQTGGVMALLMAAILLVKAWAASRTDYRRTETWMLLPANRRPPEAHARWVVTTVLEHAYTTFAMRAAGLSAGLLGSSLAVGVVTG